MELRTPLWYSVYAAAYLDEYRALMYAGDKQGYSLEVFVERNAMSTAEFARTMANTAIWALNQLETPPEQFADAVTGPDPI
jgi:hypothetical protein